MSGYPAPHRDPGHATGESSEHGSLLDHEYDGIREYDNPTPAWWHLIFIASILFSVVYFIFFHLGDSGWTVQEAWRAQQVAENTRLFGKVGSLAADEETVLRMMNEPELLSVAEGIFIANCATCHGADGGGKPVSGVNLTDDAFKNVASLMDILNVINRGAANLAMPAWENRLSQNERVILTAYVATLRGRNVPGGQPAAGNPIAPWPEAPRPSN